MDLETIAIQLIVHSGNARSKAMEAISSAKKGDLEGAERLMTEAGEFLNNAHEIQADLIQDEAEGNIKEVSVLLAHAQDHLMNAITVKDLAKEFIDLYGLIIRKCKGVI